MKITSVASENRPSHLRGATIKGNTAVSTRKANVHSVLLGIYPIDKLPKVCKKKKCVVHMGLFTAALFICFVLLSGYTHGMWKFLGQGSNPCPSSNPSHDSDNARSFTCCTIRELHCSTVLTVKNSLKHENG